MPTKTVQINKGQIVTQLLLLPYYQTGKNLTSQARGHRAFGSSDLAFWVLNQFDLWFSVFSKSSLNSWKFTVHILLKIVWRILSITLLVYEMSAIVR